MTNNNSEHNTNSKFIEPEVQTNMSAVASNPKKNIALIIGVGLAVFFIIYINFFSNDKEAKNGNIQNEKQEKIIENRSSRPPVADSGIMAPVLPTIPEPPVIEAPTPPTPPPPLPQTKEVAQVRPIGPPTPIAPIERSRELDERKKSNIMLVGGSKADEGKEGENRVTNEYFTPERTAAAQKLVTRIGNTGSVIAEGKVIDAVLETAINTDLPGSLRAVVSRDVYAEQGKKVLIPRGSRLIGSYAAEVQRGQQRINVAWSRVIMPNGYDIAIESPGIDQLGRSGVEGKVDNKYFEIFANAALVSSLNIAVASVADRLTKAQPITETKTTDNKNDTTDTRTGRSIDFATQDAVKSFGDTVKDVVRDSLKSKPTITVNQGTLLKVFVKRDLVFPVNYHGKLKVVQ